jgi:molecular chaperone GrpE (heat shock protein)
MEKDLMASGLTNMLESAQDLSLKAFVAARCAARQLAAEESSRAAVADLEAKVAALEKENEALQRHLDKSSEEKATLTTELLAAADRAVKAEDSAKAAKLLADDAKKQRALMHKCFHSFKESVRAGATKLQKELPDILKKYGLDAPDVSSGDTVGVDDFFKWLRACIATLYAGAHFNEDISAVVAVRTLSAAVYSLFPFEAASASTVMKAQLCCLRDEGFPWPGEDAVRPEALPALAKNNAKKFMDHFFKAKAARSCVAKLNE